MYRLGGGVATPGEAAGGAPRCQRWAGENVAADGSPCLRKSGDSRRRAQGMSSAHSAVVDRQWLGSAQGLRVHAMAHLLLGLVGEARGVHNKEILQKREERLNGRGGRHVGGGDHVRGGEESSTTEGGRLLLAEGRETPRRGQRALRQEEDAPRRWVGGTY